MNTLSKNLAPFLLLLFFPLTVSAQPVKKHPIEQALENCLAKNSTTAGMSNCTSKAEEMWDKELNRVYKQLLAQSNPKSRKALVDAQLNWIEYRDTEFKLISALYEQLRNSNQGGTILIPMQAGDRLEIVKQRTLELQARLNLLSVR